ncbi:MAG TPA: AI-2E family transporter, partial [Tepidisphaeraceae bacterium]|nr:AI-2E family transporter [Tepidisphaeraceae bacterium]
VGLPNTAAVIIVCTLAGLVVTGLGIVVIRQAIDLADSLPQYHANVSAKLKHLRTNPDGTIERLRNMFNSLADEWSSPERPPPEPKWLPEFFTFGDDDEAEKDEPTTAPVTVSAPPTSRTDPIDLAATALWYLVDIAVAVGIVAVFALFILLSLDDIRSRIVQLFGNRPGQLHLSTQVLEEAGERVSRYLLMLLVVNVTYGVPIGIGLYFIGIPNAALWGVLAIVLRFIPYIGPWVAAAFPVLLAIAVAPGWDAFLWTVGLFV